MTFDIPPFPDLGGVNPTGIVQMLCEVESPFSKISEWIGAFDEHAAHRLPLLRQAEQMLTSAEPVEASLRHRLADQLERWRYQHLDESCRAPSPWSCRLIEMLDLCTQRLLGRQPRQPRAARTTLENTFSQPIEVRRAIDCLNAAVPIETVAQRARRLTDEHFAVSHGNATRRRMLLYAPLYLSSYCVNYCVYCAFRHPNPLPRRHLTVGEAVGQADILMSRGFRHILLVAGDYPQLMTTEYLTHVVRALSDRGVDVALEIAPQPSSTYVAVAEAGAVGVTLYQEVYDNELFGTFHPRGRKSSYDWRLEGLERASEAGIARLGLGILVGLANPQVELSSLVRHAIYLRDRHPECTLAFSLPRIHEAPEGFVPPWPVDDETFVRMFCALRCAFPTAQLALSTRERPELRNRLAEICITQLSAGSSTVPGGYENGVGAEQCGGQFPIHDTRPPDAVRDWLDAAGFDVAWG